MFCPVGHVSLAELWREFCAKYRVRLTRAIMEKYGADDFELLDLHGAPDDYCEDVFLSTLSGMPMFAAFADGRLRRLETENDAGHSTLFAKMSAYESYLAARDPAEAGKEGYWLRKFGSDHFEIWDVGSQSLTAWKDAFAKADGEVADRACFLTLPFAFERARFVVPDAPPPWMSDVIDEHYLPPMVAAMGGGALCMDDKAALRWRGKVLGAAELPQLGDQDWVKASRRGRRNKTELIRKAYQRQFPDGHKGPWKSVMRDLQREPGLEFSEKTLRRAVGTSLNEGGKTPD